MANALTALRLLLVAPFALLMASPAHAALAGLVLAVAIATDLLDGPLARRRGSASATGAAFDHAADFLFVTGGLAAGAARGAFPWVLPALIAVAFAQYVADSYGIHRQRGLRPSRLGRYNGILYFAPLAGDIAVRAGAASVRPLVTALAWALVASTVASIGERALLARRGREQVAGRAPEE